MKEQLVHVAGCWYISGVDCAGTTKDNHVEADFRMRPARNGFSGSST